MPDSSTASQEARSQLERRFGVAPEFLDQLTFIERNDEVWACRSVPPAGIEFARPSGLRAFRRQADGLKPTSTFLTALGDRIRDSRVDLGPGELRSILLGQRISPPSPPSDGYVALCFRGDVLGCGRVRGGVLHGLLPAGRRRELLGALAVDPRI